MKALRKSLDPRSTAKTVVKHVIFSTKILRRRKKKKKEKSYIYSNQLKKKLSASNSKHFLCISTLYCDPNQMQLLSPLLIENAIRNEVNLCLTKALTVTDYLQMPSLQVKFLPPVFNFRIGRFVFPQLTDLVWGYTICCCILHAQSPVSTGHQQHQNSFIRSFPLLHKEAY